MSQQVVGTKFDNDDRTLQQLADGKYEPKQLGELVVGVRVDAIPEVEADRLAAEGKFHPLTIDKNGCLRVRMPDGIKVQNEELEVLREIRDLCAESRDLLVKLA